MAGTQTAAVTKVVGPGDEVLRIPETGTLRLSFGLSAHKEAVQSTRAGVLRQSRGGQLYLEGRQKRYIPCEGDYIVGVVIDRQFENFVVDIGGPFTAVLPQLSFEGATRRNRPNLGARDAVYARVVSAPRDAEPQLSCMDVQGKAAGMGPLKDGTLLNVSTALARQLLSVPPAPVLQALGESLQFEIAVGVNGRVWVAAPSAVHTVAVARAIVQSEFLSASQAQVMVKNVVAALQQGGAAAL